MPAVAKRSKLGKTKRGHEHKRPGDVMLPQHEAFCRALAEGCSGSEAYNRHVATKWIERSTAATGASVLMRDPKIYARVEELRVDFKEFLKRKNFGKEQLGAYLVEAIETPIGEIGPNHRLASKITLNEDGTLKSMESFSKEKAVDALAKMAGYNEPEKTEVNVSAVPEIRAAMDKLFGKREKAHKSIVAHSVVEPQFHRDAPLGLVINVTN